MNTLIRNTREVGTSAGVLLPRSWLNKQVVVTLLQPSKEQIARDVLDIIFKQGLNKEVKGIYLFGSYAREDYDETSDIDILVLTEKLNKIINENNYEILFVSEDNFLKNLSSSLNYQSILNEAEVLFNKELIEKYKIRKIDFNFKKILDEIKRILKINKDMIDTAKENSEKILDGTAYSLVLRFREMYLIKCILNNRKPNKNEFLDFIGKDIYDAYLRIKKNKKEINIVNIKDAENLYKISEKWLKELKEWKKE